MCVGGCVPPHSVTISVPRKAVSWNTLQFAHEISLWFAVSEPEMVCPYNGYWRMCIDPVDISGGSFMTKNSHNWRAGQMTALFWGHTSSLRWRIFVKTKCQFLGHTCAWDIDDFSWHKWGHSSAGGGICGFQFLGHCDCSGSFFQRKSAFSESACEGL